MDRYSRHNRILKQQLRRYGPRSIFPPESLLEPVWGVLPPSGPQIRPRAAWATHSGHCSPASRPTRGVRDVFYRVQPISASDRRAPTIVFTIRLGLMAGWEPNRSPGTTKRAQLKPVDAHWQGEATTGSKPPPPRPTGAGRCLRATFAQPGHRKRPPRRPWRGGEPRPRGPVEQRSSRARVDLRTTNQRRAQEGVTHFLAPGKPGRPPTSIWPLFSRPTLIWLTSQVS